jgi:hypothetical protein
MSRRSLASAVAALAALWSGALHGAEPFGTVEDAKAMLERAVEALKAHQAAALKAFNDEKNKQFHDRDLYVFCFSLPDGSFTAYESPVLLGKHPRIDAAAERRDRTARLRRGCQRARGNHSHDGLRVAEAWNKKARFKAIF